MLHDLARTLVGRGHQVEVVCSRRSYDGGGLFPKEEERDGVHVHRLSALGWGRRRALGRLADYGSFLAALVLRRLGSRPDLVLSLTTPPYLGLAGSWIARRTGAASAHWIMDVYPDALVAHGLAKPDGFLTRRLEALTRAQMRDARLVVALGPVEEACLGRYLSPGTRLESVALWGEEVPSGPVEAAALRARRSWKEDELVLLYSGNMGLGHRFEEFLAAAEHLGPSGPRWAFVGGGARREEIEGFVSTHPAARVELHGYVAPEDLGASLASADVHLASLSKPWQGVIVPSKIQAAFSVGRPVIFVGPDENELARWIRESDGGWIVAEGDVEGLLAAVRSARDVAERARRGQAARSFAERHFDRPRQCARLAELLEDAAGSRSGGVVR